MNPWQELVKQALIGSVSNKKLSPLLVEQLRQFGINSPDNQSSEKILLKTAAVYSKLYAVAQVPQSAPTTPLPAALPEEFSYCKKRQKQQLAYILKHHYDEILVELLDWLAMHRQIVPPDTLPDLLQYGATRPFLQPSILSCIGNRGFWLAQFSEDWAYARQGNEVQTEDIFFYGKFEQRLQYLENLHQSQPEAAIALLEQVWESEGFTNKVDFIKVLKNNLVASDEPFLEKALQDARKEVRDQAAALLAVLPHSRLVQRMQNMVSQLIQYDAKKDAFSVDLPPTCTNEMKRDGILARKDFIKDQGDKANQLAQIIAKIPPKWWCETLYKNPQQLLLLASKTEWRNVFVWGWAMAAKNYNDQEWILACHRFYLDTYFKQNWSKFSIDFLYQDLPNDVFNLLAGEYLKLDNKATLSDDHPIINFLLADGQRWDDDIATKIIQRIQKTVEQDAFVFHWNVKVILKRAAFSINPQLYPKLKEGWRTYGQSWNALQKDIDGMLDILKFRGEVLTSE